MTVPGSPSSARRGRLLACLAAFACGAAAADVRFGDLDADGRDELLLRHAQDRSWRMYDIDPGGAVPRRFGATANPDYAFAGIGDFDGDGADELLLRHVRGAWIAYALDGNRAVLRRIRGATRNLDYRLAGIGDFDGDGADELLLRHARNCSWITYAIDGARATLRRLGATRDPDHRFAGIGDFDGDGADELLLRHATERRWMGYAIDGARATPWLIGGNLPDFDHDVVGVGDFDGDGADEVVLRRAARGDWRRFALVAGSDAREAVARAVDGLTADPLYAAAGVGDFDGDGRDDVLLRHADDGDWIAQVVDDDTGAGPRLADVTSNPDWRTPGARARNRGPGGPIEVPEVAGTERRPGGAASTTLSNDEAFGQSPRAIVQDFSADANFKSGNHIFRNDHEGAGPLLNAATCQGCHTKDGRGAVPPDTDTPMDSMSLRLSIGNDARGAAVPDPNYGTLLQTFGIASFGGGGVEPGLPAFGGGADEPIGEGFAFVEYETVTGAYADGEEYALRAPVYRVRDLSYGDFADGIRFSPRVAPQLIGTGLLGAVPEATIREREDPKDLDGDGISGRSDATVDPTTGRRAMGRFGYKLSTASPLHQIVAAYRNDMGVTSRFVTREPCAERQASCWRVARLEPNEYHDGVDISDVELALVEFYVRLLAVPERRGYDEASGTWDADVLRGRALFFESGCETCHRHRMTTGVAAGSVLGRVELHTLFDDGEPIEVLSGQTIHPYTDLLLHDMGGACEPVRRETADGESCMAGDNCTWTLRCEGLADGRPEGAASGTEWRTAPLWGLGLVETVNPRATYLHDGRARTVAEAILWHGGEAEASRRAFAAMPAHDRAALLAFLRSL